MQYFQVDTKSLPMMPLHGGYEVREHRKDDAVSASTLPIGGSDIWKRGYLSLFVRPLMLLLRKSKTHRSRTQKFLGSIALYQTNEF